MNVPLDPHVRRQWYLDESLRIAVWEVIFGTGPHERVAELLASGARWQADKPEPQGTRRSLATHWQ